MLSPEHIIALAEKAQRLIEEAHTILNTIATNGAIEYVDEETRKNESELNAHESNMGNPEC